MAELLTSSVESGRIREFEPGGAVGAAAVLLRRDLDDGLAF